MKSGTKVRVWPGIKGGRSAVTTTTTDERLLGGHTSGHYVLESKDADGKRTPGGFYALSHIEAIEETS